MPTWFSYMSLLKDSGGRNPFVNTVLRLFDMCFVSRRLQVVELSCLSSLILTTSSADTLLKIFPTTLFCRSPVFRSQVPQLCTSSTNMVFSQEHDLGIVDAAIKVCAMRGFLGQDMYSTPERLAGVKCHHRLRVVLFLLFTCRLPLYYDRVNFPCHERSLLYPSNTRIVLLFYDLKC